MNRIDSQELSQTATESPDTVRSRAGQPGPAAPPTLADCTHVWFWKSKLPERKGQPCRVRVIGRLNNALVEFIDGFKVVTSRHAVRRLKV